MPEFTLLEATITGIHQAIKDGSITCRSLAESYLKRVETYDKPTGLNSIIRLNPDALRRADELDLEYRMTGRLRPLHGVPVIIKENYDTHDLPTSAGALALKDSIPPDDAFIVRRIREAGGIVLAKSNMAEWAFSPLETVSSLGGTTCNPYDLKRVPAGSSGGTAAAVAANLGAVGLGTDTGNSIRGPSGHCCLVGLRSTMGLTSRDGIIPLNLRNDVGGPICRTVEDAVKVLEVIAGYDPADPITEHCVDHVHEDYTQYLDADGLKGARIGVFRYYTDKPTADDEVKAVFEQAISDCRAHGAILVDPFTVPTFEELRKNLWRGSFHHDINNYLTSLGEGAPYRTLQEVYDSGLYLESLEPRLKRSLEQPLPEEPLSTVYSAPGNIKLREAIIAEMDRHSLDAFIYPTWNNPPRLLDDKESPSGDNSQIIPPHTGLPGFSVPMGYTRNILPAGLQIVSRLFDEPTLIRIAYSYEQATKHRKHPASYPIL